MIRRGATALGGSAAEAAVVVASSSVRALATSSRAARGPAATPCRCGQAGRVQAAAQGARRRWQSSLAPAQAGVDAEAGPSSAQRQLAAEQPVDDADEELPWFMREQPSPATDSAAQESVVPKEERQLPAHLVRTPELQELFHLLTTGPIGKLVATADDLVEYDKDTNSAAQADPAAQQPIIFLPTAAIAAALPPHEGAGVAYSDWIILVRARTSAGGALGRIALEVGEFLKRTRPPASHARSHLEQIELRSSSDDIFSAVIRETETKDVALKASEQEYAELIFALEAWTRKHNIPSLFQSQHEQGGILEGYPEDSSRPLFSPLSSLRSARIRRTYRATPIKTISSDDAGDEVDRGPRPAGWSRIEWEAGRRLPSWAVQKEALRRKLLLKSQQSHESDVSGHRAQAKPFWRPGKILSRSAQDGIRTLHAYDPKGRFSAPELSRAFGISVESVRRILRAGGSRRTVADGEAEGDVAVDEGRRLSWLDREMEVHGSVHGNADDVETVEQRQERRAAERRVERVKKIIERVTRERAAMDDEPDQDQTPFMTKIGGDAPEHRVRESYETHQLLNQLDRRQAASQPLLSADDEADDDGEDTIELESDPIDQEEWTQPIHYEGLSPAQSNTLSGASVATSRPAFKSSRSALPSRTARASKGDGDGNWVVVDAGWCIVHVLSENGWAKYGPDGGIGEVWREWLAAVERHREWDQKEGDKGGRSKGVLAQALGLGAHKKRARV